MLTESCVYNRTLVLLAYIQGYCPDRLAPIRGEGRDGGETEYV